MKINQTMNTTTKDNVEIFRGSALVHVHLTLLVVGIILKVFGLWCHYTFMSSTKARVFITNHTIVDICFSFFHISKILVKLPDSTVVVVVIKGH